VVNNKQKIVRDGKTYFTVGATARLLSTTGNEVREIMGRGDLEWTQFRMNGRLLITAASIAAYKMAVILHEKLASNSRRGFRQFEFHDAHNADSGPFAPRMIPVNKTLDPGNTPFRISVQLQLPFGRL
jgi:hypothetical protein